MPPQTLRFGRFELQPRERRLLVDGAPVALGARAFDLLLAMIARPGQLLTKGELLDEVWPGLVVEEANLSVQVSSLRKVLGGDLIATIPGRGYRFTGTPAQDGSDLAPATTPAAPSPLGAATSPSPPAKVLIGRDEDLSRLEASMRHPGIVTLTGPAGVGKTALARVLAARTERGALWVELAPLTQGEQVFAAMARALAIPLPEGDPWPSLLRALGGRLVVLDNAEHLIDAIAVLAAQLLRAAPAQHVLVTSQQPLRVDGERVQRIEPLALPMGSDSLDLHQGAVALFVERARAADHRFPGSPEQLPLLREICRRLDGIPLALEMAAARVPVLGLVGLRDALEERFALLTVGRRDAAVRHRTLQAALDWSHGLLRPEEQRLFRICGVFSGGFTLELLVQVAVEPSRAAAPESRWAVIDTLANLADSSLVSTDAGDPPRFALLETMRDYARQRLGASGDEAALRSRHARALAELAERADAAITDHNACALMLIEHDNVREAIAWLLANEPALAVETVISVARVATFSAWRQEALRWLESCESVVEGGTLAPPLRARWWRARAHQWLMNRDPRARAMAERAVELHREVGDDKGEFEALGMIVRASVEPTEDLEGICTAMRALLGRHPEWTLLASMSLAGAEARACSLRADYEAVLRHRLVEHQLACRMNDLVMIDASDTNVVATLARLGRHEEALARSRAILERLPDSDSGNAAWAWHGHLGSLLALGRFDEFRVAALRAASILRKHGLPLLTDQYAVLLAEEGRAHDAARMIGHARSAYQACGMAIEEEHLGNLDRAERLARVSMDEAIFTRRVAEGRLLDDAAADRMALGPPEKLKADSASRVSPRPER